MDPKLLRARFQLQSESSGLEVLSPRNVPLGGQRAMTVRRTLPQRDRTLIGAWCFIDHYGPDEVGATGGMSVPPHPHTGLATVSWLFTGEVEHRDSAGHHAIVRPGEVNLMTAGRGISHSEYSTPATTTLHGAQLWVALPEGSREIDPRFEHYAPPLAQAPGLEHAEVRVFLGSLFGSTSPVETETPLLGVEILMGAGARIEVPVDSSYEHGILLDRGDLMVDDETLAAHELGFRTPGASTLTLSSEAGAVLLLLGGPPFGEQIVMWWNFIGRTHEDIVEHRERWQSLLASGQDSRFALPDGDPLPPLNAPPMPHVRLKTRG